MVEDFIENNYNFTNNKNDFVKAEDVFIKFKTTEFYGKLNMIQKRYFTRKYIYNWISSNNKTQHLFYTQKSINNVLHYSIITNMTCK